MSIMEGLLVALLVATAVACVLARTPRSWRQKLMIGTGVLLSCSLVAGVAISRIMFPMFEAPPPSGAHGVGIADLHFVDPAREETMTDDRDDRRELMVRVWYPARVPEGAEPEPFLREVEPLHHILTRGMPYLPVLMLDHLLRIPSHSYLDAPLAEAQGRFPVLIFSHGNSFYAGQNALLMEHLASHGYAVFSIEHPYQAAWVKFPDGRIAKYRNNWNVEGTIDQERLRQEEETFYRALYAGDYEEYRASLTELIEGNPGANTGVGLWLDDTTLLLDELARTGGAAPGGHGSMSVADRQAAMERFAGRLDLERVGVFGMSYGGAVAGEFCSQDARCKAGLNMDGLQYGAAGTSLQIPRPFMFLYADQRGLAATRNEGVDASTPTPFHMNDFAWRQVQGVAYSLTIAGAAHMSFSDFALTAAMLRKAGMLGSIDPEVMRELLNDTVLAFFNQTLQGTREPLLDGALVKRRGVLEFEARDGRATAVE